MSDDLSCLGELPDKWWRDRTLCACGRPHTRLEHEVTAHGSFKAAADAHKISFGSIKNAWADLGCPPREGGQKMKMVETADESDEWLLKLLKRRGNITVEELADQADLSPRRVRDAADRLRASGYRVELDETGVSLSTAPVESQRTFQLGPEVFDGETVRVGVVSDTHLGADEEALEELHTAYDVFEREGITEVWHAGDWGTGVGMFKTHHSEAHVHTGPEQVKYLVENYPRRDGITTRGISGNHDLEGDFGRIGYDPISVFAYEREDVEYLGEYSAWFEVRPDAYIHLLHGSGGMGYAMSYKAQRLADSYPSGRKPNVLIVGHWHVRADFETRNIKVLFPGCFEWQSRYMKRLGLQPAVGFHILQMTIAEDGSIVRWLPEWFQFYSGRR